MKNFVSTIIGAVAIALIQPQVTLAQESLSLPELKQQSQQFTVKIETPGEPGSGVIVGQNGNTYYVLTASHVVSGVVEGEELFLFAFDGEKDNKYKLNVSKIEFLPNNMDLALIQFESDRQYATATISKYDYPLYEHRDYQSNAAGEAEESKQHVFVSGWPLNIKDWDICQGQQPAEYCQQPVFSAGFLFDNSATAVSQPNVANSDDDFGGYELIYTNLTYPGMSGGAVLDSQGRLIGIHGRADGRKIGREDEVLSQYLDEEGKSDVSIKIGMSLGLPIKSFLNSPPGSQIYSYLNVEDTAPPTIDLTNVESIEAPLVVTDRENPYHWIEKGNRLWRIGEPSIARGSFENAIALKEDLYLAWFAKGFMLGFDGQYALALEACDRAVELNVVPNEIKYESYRCKAGALQQLNRPEEALTALESALEVNSSNPADMMLKGELNFALGKYDLALESLDTAVNMRKTQNLADSALLYNNRALVKLELGQLDSALTDVEQAIATNTNFAPAYRNQALILETMDRNEESLAAYERALELDPNDRNTWTNKGFTLYKLQRISEAKQAFEEALKIDPNYQPALDNLEAIE